MMRPEITVRPLLENMAPAIFKAPNINANTAITNDRFRKFHVVTTFKYKTHKIAMREIRSNQLATDLPPLKDFIKKFL